MRRFVNRTAFLEASISFLTNMGQKNFFIYSHINFSDKSAASTRMLCYAKALASTNNKVYLTGCCAKELSDPCFFEKEPNIYVLKENKMVLSFWGTFLFLRRLSQFASGKTDEPIFLLYPSTVIYMEFLTLLYFKFYKRYPVFYELNEIRKYASSFQNPISFKRIIYSFKKIVFKSVFTIAQPLLYFYDGLICISTAIEKYGKQFNNNTLRIPILTDPKTDSRISDQVYSTKKSFNIGFSGSIHPMKENLDEFIEIIERLKNQGYSISFNLCGSIFKTYKSYFLEQCELKEELNYYGFLNELEMSTFLSQQHLLVVPRGHTLQNQYGFSTKLSDYLNHRKMVLITDVSDNGLYIRDGENGFIVAPDEPEQMYKKLEYIIKNYETIKENIEQNAFATATGAFNYMNYKASLQNFLTY